MPGGLANPLAGYVAFTAVKFGGYTFAAWRLNRSYSEQARNVVAVGATRTGIGMAFGTVLTMLLFPLIFTGGPGLVVGYLVFVPVRLCEWWLIILIFYDRQLETRAKDWRCVAVGTLWSYILDAPAIIGLFATGGFWIC